MSLTAKVKRVTGATKHYIGRIVDDAVVKESEIAAPVSVVITASDGAFLLLRMDAQGHCLADTWHETVEEAKRQAAFEFEIGEDDWREGAE
jgi:hypothetical protein